MAKSTRETTVHGWAVTRSKRPNGAHVFTFVKDHPSGKNGRLAVSSSSANEEVGYQVGLRDALMEDVRVSTKDDEGIWLERMHEANRDVVIGKVRRLLAKKDRFPDRQARDAYAIPRLVNAGVPLARIAEITKDGED